MNKTDKEQNQANAPSSPGGLSQTLKAYKLEIGMFLVLIILFIILHFATGTALTARNLKNVLQACAPLFIISLGQLLVVITGGIDLSVGSIFSFAGMVATLCMIKFGIAAGIAAGLGVGLLCGLFNGFFVAKVKMAPFIVTLAMQGAASSLTFIVAGGNSQTISNHTSFAAFDRGSFLFGLPNYITYMIIAVILLQFILRKTMLGRWIYATGSNEEAARLVGIPVVAVKITCYTVCGALCGLAALLNASYLLTVECTAGTGMELNAIAATVIGGASLSGGLGSAFGVLIGALISTGINNGINLMGINTFWSGTVTGVVIIVAVLIGSITTRKTRK